MLNYIFFFILGLEFFCSLAHLDVTANCIMDFKDFSQLAALEKLCIVRCLF